MEIHEGRILALDIGQRRIGVAMSDLSHTIAQAHSMFQRRHDHDQQWLKDFKKLVEQEEVMEIVIGLPLHMSGDEGTQAEYVRTVGEEIKKIVSCPIHFVDERLSTVTAERTLIQAGLSREKRKSVRDALAAQVFLQMYLDRRKNEQGLS